MGWSVNIANVKPDEALEAFDLELNAVLEDSPFDSWDDDVAAQQASVRDTLQVLIEGDGIRGDLLNVSTGGHRLPQGMTGYDSWSLSVSTGGAGLELPAPETAPEAPPEPEPTAPAEGSEPPAESG